MGTFMIAKDHEILLNTAEGVFVPTGTTKELVGAVRSYVGKNASLNNCSVEARCGSIFDPWKNEKFDYIVDDVAGVAQEVVQISPWYNNVPCESGVDGTLFVCKIIEEAQKYFNPQGLLFSPAISFPNIKTILKTAQNNFSHVEKVSHTEWPLPKEMYAHVGLLQRLQAENYIQYIEKFGLVLYFTDVYVAY